jgi:hypothetical protein
MFHDLAKAFYCVNHDIIASKLNFYRITGKANKWIKHTLGIGSKSVCEN